MKEDRKRQGFSNNKFLAAVVITALFLSGSTPASARTVSEHSNKVTEQMQNQTIKVTVVDSHNNPIIGANVIEKGTTNGGITDLDGKVQLTVKNNAILQVSFVGYKMQEVKAAPTLKVVLKEDTELLDEVVVVGYGSQKKANLTGAVANVDVNEAIASRPITDVAKALQGVSPGLTITNNQGGVGTESNIKLRGSYGSINATSGTTPLILVDRTM